MLFRSQKKAMPVLNERMIASALLLAGAMGANISRVVAVIAFFWACISFKSFFLRRDISSNVNFCGEVDLRINIYRGQVATDNLNNANKMSDTIDKMPDTMSKVPDSAG